MLEGIITVYQLEIKQRLRTTKWVVILTIWFIFITLAAIGSFLSLTAGGEASTDKEIWALTISNLVVIGTLAVGILVTPSLASMSINHDRDRQTLAVIQATTLSSTEIALGKFLAANTGAILYLILATPIGFIFGFMGKQPGRVALGFIAVFLFFIFTSAVSLWFSSLVNRPSTSTALSYIVISMLVMGIPVIFGVTQGNFSTTETVKYKTWSLKENLTDEKFWPLRERLEKNPTYEVTQIPPELLECVEKTRSITSYPVDFFMPLLYINPFIIVSDALPGQSSDNRITPAGAVATGTMRLANINYHEAVVSNCPTTPKIILPARGTPLPENLASHTGYRWIGYSLFILLVSLLAIGHTSSRLKVPLKHLPRGTRVA